MTTKPTVPPDTLAAAARAGIRITDDRESMRRFDLLAARYGWTAAAAAWAKACADYDAEYAAETELEDAAEAVREQRAGSLHGRNVL